MNAACIAYILASTTLFTAYVKRSIGSCKINTPTNCFYWRKKNIYNAVVIFFYFWIKIQRKFLTSVKFLNFHLINIFVGYCNLKTTKKSRKIYCIPMHTRTINLIIIKFNRLLHTNFFIINWFILLGCYRLHASRHITMDRWKVIL